MNPQSPTGQLNSLPPAPGAPMTPMQSGDFAHTLSSVKARIQVIQRAMKESMLKDVHYGIIPGTDKPALLKPGAEMICALFGLCPSTVPTHITDQPDLVRAWKGRKKRYFDGPRGNREWAWESIEGETTGFYEVLSTTTLTDQTGRFVAAQTGSCNNLENKYREQIVWDVRNTILKMSGKRSLIATVLAATGASDMFTQDLEDDVEGHAEGHGEGTGSATGSAKPAPRSAANQVGEWLSEAQSKAVWAKGKAANLPDAAIKATIDGLNAAGKQAGRPDVDAIFKGGDAAAAVFAKFAPKPAEAAPAPEAGSAE